MLDKMWFWLAIFLIITLVVLWLKREEVKKQVKMSLSLKTIGQSWTGKLLKSIGVVALTFACTIAAIAFGVEEKTMVTVAAFLILTELAVIWKPKKYAKESAEDNKSKDDAVVQENKQVTLARRFGRWIGKKQESKDDRK